jgi:hypothetical protein
VHGDLALRVPWPRPPSFKSHLHGAPIAPHFHHFITTGSDSNRNFIRGQSHYIMYRGRPREEGILKREGPLTTTRASARRGGGRALSFENTWRHGASTDIIPDSQRTFVSSNPWDWPPWDKACEYRPVGDSTKWLPTNPKDFLLPGNYVSHIPLPSEEFMQRLHTEDHSTSSQHPHSPAVTNLSSFSLHSANDAVLLKN